MDKEVLRSVELLRLLDRHPHGHQGKVDYNPESTLVCHLWCPEIQIE